MQNDNLYSMMGKIKEDSLGQIYNQGAWHKFNGLDEVLRNMQENEMGSTDKYSLPDVFGRAIQYKISFEAVKCKMYSEKTYLLIPNILEWRGVITAIALKDFLELKMKIDILQYEQNSQGFDKALKHPPEAEIFKDEENWEKETFHILKLKGDNGEKYIDIAMFSQLTAIYPVADLAKIMPEVQKISWFDYREKRFLNPVTKLTETEKMIVYSWLGNFRKVLEKEGDKANTILFHINAYCDELGINSFTEKQCFTMTEVDSDYKCIEHGKEIYEIINKTIELQMKHDGACNISYKSLFANQIYYTVSEDIPFGECKSVDKHKIKNSRMEGKEWYAFFPIGNKVAEINNIDQNFVNSLVDNMEMFVEYKPGGIPKCIRVKLNLSAISNTEIDIEKVFYWDKGEVIEEERTDFPVIAVWPSYNPACKKYYVYIYGGKQGKIETVLNNSEVRSNHFVKAVNDFPRIISLQRTDNAKVPYDIGMILPIYNDVVSRNGAVKSAIVGIDFGTSGTTVYAQIDGKSPMQIKIWEDCPLLLTQADDGDLAMLNQWFIGKNKRGDKLQSVYRRTTDGPIREVVPILDGIIYQADEKEMIVASSQYMPNIKWDDIIDGIYYEAFIEELCIHVWNKLRNYFVTQIEWRYALPSNFKGIETFKKVWNNNIKSFLDKNINISKHIVGAVDYTESEAASLYFQKLEQQQIVNVRKGYIVVDIGGGSTDIAVWQRREQNTVTTLIAQTSVQVAGRMLFTRWIAKNMPDIKEYISISDEWDKLFEFKEDNDIVNAIIEKIIQNENDSIKRVYLKDSKWSRHLREQLEFGTALLFFALGSFIGHLQEKDALKIQDKMGNFSIAVGGNGSKILEWLEGENDDFIKLSEMFREGVRSRAIDSGLGSFPIIKSNEPKKEVALGLLQEKEKSWNDIKIDVTEEITVELAIKWNRIFLDKYNILFSRNQEMDIDQICAIVENNNQKMDVCNFFMSIMYIKYYKNIIGRNMEDGIKNE